MWKNSYSSGIQNTRVTSSSTRLNSIYRFLYFLIRKFSSLSFVPFSTKVLYPQPKDSGIYECQISTTPPVGVLLMFSVVGKAMIFNRFSRIKTYQALMWCDDEEEDEDDEAMKRKGIFSNWKFTHVKKLTPYSGIWEKFAQSDWDEYSFMVLDNVILLLNVLVCSVANPFFIILWLRYVDIEPTTTILGTPELYIDTGSTVNLTCVVHGLNEPPTVIQWTHNGFVSYLLLWPSSNLKIACK